MPTNLKRFYGRAGGLGSRFISHGESLRRECSIPKGARVPPRGCPTFARSARTWRPRKIKRKARATRPVTLLIQAGAHRCSRSTSWTEQKESESQGCGRRTRTRRSDRRGETEPPHVRPLASNLGHPENQRQNPGHPPMVRRHGLLYQKAVAHSVRIVVGPADLTAVVYARTPGLRSLGIINRGIGAVR